MEERIIKKALYAYENIGFYRWFYEKKGISRAALLCGEIPYFDKLDLFEFERETGKLFYEDIKIESDYKFYVSTTGTMGKVLSIPYDIRKTKFVNSIGRMFDYIYTHRKQRCTNIAVPINVPDDIARLYRLIEKFTIGNFIEVFDVNEYKKILKEEEICVDTVVDMTLEIARMYAENPELINKCGLKNIIYMTMEKGLYEKLKACGVTLISFYGSMELGLIGYKLYEKSDVNYYLFTDDVYEVVKDDKEIAHRGKGKLLATIEASDFPFIRYHNGDIVSLFYDEELGVSNIMLHGRDMNVYIPNEYEANVDYKAIANYFLQKKDILKVQFFQIKVTEKGIPGAESNVLCTLLDIGQSEIQRAEDDFSFQCMRAGIGTEVEGYLKYFPVYYVPSKNMVNNGRVKYFFNLENGKENLNWEKFFPVIEKIAEDYGYVILQE